MYPANHASVELPLWWLSEGLRATLAGQPCLALGPVLQTSVDPLRLAAYGRQHSLGNLYYFWLLICLHCASCSHIMTGDSNLKLTPLLGTLCVLQQMQQQAQRDMATGALNEQTVNAYFQQHMQKVRA